jgi:hypothetical protein
MDTKNKPLPISKTGDIPLGSDKKTTLASQLSTITTSGLNSLSTLEKEVSKNAFTPWWIVMLIILSLLFFGGAIYFYLAKGYQGINDLFSTFINNFGYNSVVQQKLVQEKPIQQNSDKQTTSTESVPTTGPTPNPNTPINNTTITSKGQEYVSNEDHRVTNNSLTKKLNSSSKIVSAPYSPDDSHSVTQSSKVTNKAGWCYVGEERGFRSCASVGPSDECMSGDIFPTRDVCMNPSLRV